MRRSIEAPDRADASKLKMKWVLSGGTGFIGRRLTALLVEDGDEVVVLSRRASAPGETGPRLVAWEPGRMGDWSKELDGAGAVVNLAGAGVMDERWTEQRLALLRSSRVETTRVLADAIAHAHPAPGVLVSASAIGIYGMRMDDDELGEDGGQGSDVLASICQAWERAADPARAAGVRVVHPRIGIVLGASGGALERMLPAFKAFVGGPIGTGRQWFSWIHIDDVVGAMRFAAGASELSGAFNAVAPHPVRMKEFAGVLGQVLRRPARLRVPGFALRAMLGEGAQALLTGQRVRPRMLEQHGYRFRFPELRGALENVLGRGR